MSITMQDLGVTGVTRLVDDYLSGWNEVDPIEREQIIERCWDPGAALVDPSLTGQGRAGFFDAPADGASATEAGQ